MRGFANVLGAAGLKLREAISALETRMTSVERAISSSTAAQGKPGGGATLDAAGKLAAAQKPAYTAAEVGAVPVARKINNKPLSGDIALTPADVGAAPAVHTHTRAQITDFPASLPASDVPAWAKAASKPKYTAAEVGAAAAGHTHTAAQVGAAAANHTHTAAQAGAKASAWSPFHAGTSAPGDRTQFWIDTSGGGLKYWNGSAWVAVPVAYT